MSTYLALFAAMALLPVPVSPDKHPMLEAVAGGAGAQLQGGQAEPEQTAATRQELWRSLREQKLQEEPRPYRPNFFERSVSNGRSGGWTMRSSTQWLKTTAATMTPKRRFR